MKNLKSVLRGKDAPNWKGRKASKSAVHKWLDSNYGKPKTCEMKRCMGTSIWFDWSLIHGRKYTHNRNNFRRLCRRCHQLYDGFNERVQSYRKSSENKIKVSVVQIDNHGNTVKVWDSISNAARFFGNMCHAGSIVLCCQGKLKHCNGFTWKYFNKK